MEKYPLPRTDGETMPWRRALAGTLCILIIVGALFALVRFVDPTMEEEEGLLYKTAFSHPYIVERTGSVRSASFAHLLTHRGLRFGRGIQRDFKRRKVGTSIEGVAKMFIVGVRDGGFFEITYVYETKTKLFVVKQVSAPDFDNVLPNQSLEPTPKSVTDRASARSAPAMGVAQH